MNKELWDRLTEAANGRRTIEAVDLASALVELRAALDALKANDARRADSLHHIDKHLGRLSSACKVPYGRVTAELLGE
ncbi:MAG: hypothetical protein ACREHD_32790 [Pirellulales bacterium]